MKAVGYFRAGVDDDRERRSSLVEQEKAFFDFCQRQGFEPTATFADDELAQTGNKTQYHQMLDFLRQPGRGFIAVVIQHPDNLGAEPKEVIRRFLELEDMGARVLCTDEKVVDPLALEVEEWTRRQGDTIGNKVRSAMLHRAMRGEGLGKPAFGYRIGVDRKFEIVPEEAPVVELIFRLYLEKNMGMRLITRYLNEREITTRTGNRWSMIGIRDILRNRTYTGTYSRFGVQVIGNHPAIISPRIFRSVQDKIARKRRVTGAAQVKDFLLSGMVYCGYCSNKMIGVSRRQSWTRRRDGEKSHAEYRYYQCQSRTNQGVCQYRTRKADELENSVLAWIEERKVLGKVKGDSAVKVDVMTTERAQTTAEMKALDNRLDDFIGQAADGSITMQQLRITSRDIIRQLGELERKLFEIADERERLESATRQKELFETSLRQIHRDWDSLSITTRKSLLQNVIDRIVIYDVDTDINMKEFADG